MRRACCDNTRTTVFPRLGRLQTLHCSAPVNKGIVHWEQRGASASKVRAEREKEPVMKDQWITIWGNCKTFKRSFQAQENISPSAANVSGCTDMCGACDKCTKFYNENKWHATSPLRLEACPKGKVQRQQRNRQAHISYQHVKKTLLSWTRLSCCCLCSVNVNKDPMVVFSIGVLFVPSGSLDEKNKKSQVNFFFIF